MVSVIIPVYNEEKNLLLLQEELNSALNSVGAYEVIYVDDGSKDNSFEVLNKIKSCHKEVKVIQFARHFGQTEAMQAGIDYSSGEILVFLDADLQNDPKDIPRLLAKIKEGFGVVSGWRKKRKDPFLNKKLPSFIANMLISKITKVKLHDLGCSLKAYRREVFDHVRLYSEMHRFIPIYVARQGVPIVEIEVSHRKRNTGNSKYGPERTFKVILDFLVAEFINNYLNKPMYVFGACGIFLMFLSSGIGIFILVRKLFWGGLWVSPLIFVMAIFIIIGVQLILMGLIAEVVMRIYYENTKKNTYSVKREL
ncbi:glycosyltransferase family 2 protein [Candidatus Omnitrophota bacterium]